jgi:hypothetical protein
MQLVVTGDLDRQHFEVGTNHLQKIIEIMCTPPASLPTASIFCDWGNCAPVAC